MDIIAEFLENIIEIPIFSNLIEDSYLYQFAIPSEEEILLKST